MKASTKNILKLTIGGSLILILAILIFVLNIYQGKFGQIPNEKEILAFNNDFATSVYSSDQHLIGTIAKQHRIKIEYQDIPHEIVEILIAVEDRRFYLHEGIDFTGLLRAFKGLLLNKQLGGGSTISQQLAKNMYGRQNHKLFSTPINKIKEMIIAHRIEKLLSKEEIIEKYLNTVPFGDNVYGLESASLRYFNQSASELRIEQSCVLIGLLKANTYYNPAKYPDHAISRRNDILNLLEAQQLIDKKSKDSLKLLALDLNYKALEKASQNEYFIEIVKSEAKEILAKINDTLNIETDGLLIKTTLNYYLQNSAISATQTQLDKMQNAMNRQYAYSTLVSKKGKSTKTIDSLHRELIKLHSGFFAMHPKSGAILAYLGGLDYRKYPYDQVQAKRQLASVFKPILYASALENGFTACSMLDNSALVLKDFDDWNPENSNQTVGGQYSLSYSLAHSMNVPSIRVFIESDFDEIKSCWHGFGFSETLENRPSSALGVANASLYEVGVAYSAFANAGLRVAPFSILSISTKEGELIYDRMGQVESTAACSEEVAATINAILNKALKEGTGKTFSSTYGLNFQMAAKTGTSQNYRDAWFVCYNSSIVMATRVGANSPKYHFNNGNQGAASALALPIVAKTIKNHLRTKQNIPYYSGLATADLDENCKDFKDDGIVRDILSSFRKNGTTLEKEEKRLNRKRKIQNFTSLFN